MAKQKKRTMAEKKANAEKCIRNMESGKRITKNMVSDLLEIHPEILYQEMPDAIKELFPVVSMDIATDVFHIHFTMKHNAKMTGMFSLSSTCIHGDCLNKIAAAYRLVDEDFTWETATAERVKMDKALLKKYIEKNPLATNASICGLCFSFNQQSFMETVKEPLSHNFEMINGGIINPDWLPTINALYFRGEAFGDFNSKNAVANFMNLIKKNPAVYFGIWTKNPKYFDMVFGGDSAAVPANANFIYSSQFINKKTSVPKKYRYFISKTFTVYTPQYAKKFGIAINCGARACLACLKCYTKNNINEIAELLK